MDTIFKRIHSVFGHHNVLFALPIRIHPQPLLKSMYYLRRHVKFLLSSFHTYISRILRTSLHHVRTLIFQKPYDTYPSPSAEQKYWDSAERGLRQLRLSDARFVGSERPKNVRVPEMPPLIMYYVPALLPQYRDEDEKNTRRRKGRIKQESCRLEPEDYYCQWHNQVVFSDSDSSDF